MSRARAIIRGTRSGVSLPPSLFSTSSSAPNTSMLRRFSRYRVVAHDAAAIALHRAYERERDAGAAAGVFDDRHPGFQGAALLRAFDHRERHAILVGTGGIVVLVLDPHVGRTPRHDARQSDEWRVADGSEHGC